MNIQNIIDDLRLLRAKNNFIKKITEPFVGGMGARKQKRVIDKLKENFNKNGLNVLKYFDDILTENGYQYSLAFGTMLGAVREHGFIKHDADIDTFMWIEDRDSNLFCLLKNAGFRITHTYSVDNDSLGCEDTIEYEGVQIDIFYIYPPIIGRSHSYCCDFIVFSDCLTRMQSVRKHGGLLPRRIEIPIVKDLVRIPFETHSFPIIKNAHEFLSFRYGGNYMTPDPNWANGPNPYIIPWPEKVAIYKEY